MQQHATKQCVFSLRVKILKLTMKTNYFVVLTLLSKLHSFFEGKFSNKSSECNLKSRFFQIRRILD